LLYDHKSVLPNLIAAAYNHDPNPVQVSQYHQGIHKKPQPLKQKPNYQTTMHQRGDNAIAKKSLTHLQTIPSPAWECHNPTMILQSLQEDSTMHASADNPFN